MCPLLCSALLILAFPNFELSFLAWIAFVPILHTIRGSSLVKTFAVFYIAGLLFFGGTLYWLAYVTKLGYFIFIAYLSLYFGLFGVFSKIFFSKFERSPFSFLLCLIIPSLWVLMEFLRGTLFTGFPWCFLGHTQYKNPLIIQIADVTGAYGVSFLIVAANVVIYSCIESRKLLKSQAIILALLLFTSLAYGAYRLHEKPADTGIRLSVVQGSIEQLKKWDPSYEDYILNRYETLTYDAAKDKGDMIIWPETAIPGFLDDALIQASLKRVCGGIRSPLFTGALTYTEDAERYYYFNSAVLFAPDGSVYKKHDKIHLVPFGEYIPFEAHIPFFRGSINTEIGDCTPGSEFTIFNIMSKNGDMYKYGALICFEDIFPDLARNFSKKGADFLINITNDAWFGESNEQLQHAQASVFRAVENRLSIVRAANTGLSCYINPSGIIEDGIYDNNTGSIYAEGFKTFHVLAKKEKTFYTAHGDFVICTCLIVVIGCYFMVKKA